MQSKNSTLVASTFPLSRKGSENVSFECYMYQLYAVSILVLSLWLLVPSLYLHRLEWLGEVVALGKVLGPLRDVSLEQRTLFTVLHNPLKEMGRKS